MLSRRSFLLTGVAIGALLPKSSLFLSAAKMGDSLEVLLAQDRSVGTHIFVWPDGRLDED
jgi:hypothetical protein